MKFLNLAWLAIFVLGGAGPETARAVAAPDKAPEIKLPADAKAAVITLDYQGKGRRRRLNEAPVLVIRADGTATVTDSWGDGGAGAGKLTPAQLQALLAYIVHDKQFFQFDSDKAQKAIEASKEKIADAGEVVIKVQANGKEHTARVNGLEFYAEQNLDLKSLAQLQRIHARLQHVLALVALGAPDKIEDDLKIANEHLLKKHPKAAPLTLDDVTSASIETENGKKRATVFFMRVKDPKNPSENFVRVVLARHEKGNTEVEVTAKP